MESEICQKAVAALRRRGYEAVYAPDAETARAIVMREAENAATVGWGGSETIREIGVCDAIVAAGKRADGLLNGCDLFLLSANALLADGRIVNIDGNGNRVSASIFGPGRVIYVIGRNKIVEGGIDDAVARIRREACPPNARRLGRKTPCALTGRCADCDSPDRMCKVIAVFERKPSRQSALCVVVDADLGY